MLEFERRIDRPASGRMAMMLLQATAYLTMTNDVSPYVRRQISRCERIAAHYRTKAEELRSKAAQYEAEAEKASEAAARWAASADFPNDPREETDG
jgi:hypothetical protein